MDAALLLTHTRANTYNHKHGQVDGFWNKMRYFFILLHDSRFVGDWAKNNNEAKMWGFFLANTAGLWFCFSFPLVRKVASAIAANVQLPPLNASLLVAIYW